MTRHFGIRPRHELPPTNDARRAARGIIIGAICGSIMWAIVVICLFFAAGVLAP